MAPTGKMTSKTFTAKTGNKTKQKNVKQDFKKKRKWVTEHKTFEGGVKEGQGFAFKRKEKARHEYNRLLRKEKRRINSDSKPQYKDEYPEHLRHLYLAEAEKLKQEAWTNRLNRSKLRVKGQEQVQEQSKNEAAAAAEPSEATGTDPRDIGGSEPSPADVQDANQTASPDKESLPMSNRMKKKMQRKSSYQKTREEYEQIIEKRKEKKEKFLKDKQQREEAIQKYKQKKMETFQMLSKKTKKGQPNLNLQMEYLLQKIQGKE